MQISTKQIRRLSFLTSLCVGSVTCLSCRHADSENFTDTALETILNHVPVNEVKGLIYVVTGDKRSTVILMRFDQKTPNYSKIVDGTKIVYSHAPSEDGAGAKALYSYAESLALGIGEYSWFESKSGVDVVEKREKVALRFMIYIYILSDNTVRVVAAGEGLNKE